MLRSVCLKNYVKFKDYQVLDFSSGGANYFIGENGSGKSSVLEGIRRCLKAELSTSVSSVPDSRQLSYFICNFEGGATEKENDMDNVICGIVVMPDIIEDNDSESETDSSLSESESGGSLSDLGTNDLFDETQTQFKETHKEDTRKGHESQELPMEKKNIDPADTLRNITCETTDETLNKANLNMTKRYKFVMRKTGPMHVMKTTSSSEVDSTIKMKQLKDITDDDFKKKRHHFIDAVVEQKDTDEDIKKYLYAVFNRNYIHTLNNEQREQIDACKTEKVAGDAKITKEADDRKTEKVAGDGKTTKEANDRKTEKVTGNGKTTKEADDRKTEKVTGDGKTTKEAEDCETLLESLSSQIVFTFPLRSIGPLQWSESKRIHHGQRENNYLKAEKRCEIIKCYLADDGTKFNKEIEQDMFQTITQRDDYIFELTSGGQITLPKSKYALLKTPEGILEAKALSILLSGEKYKTIILEEPDRGMHPQYIERMMHVINRYKDKKRVILTTHNVSLITPWTLPNCFVFKRKNEDHRIISGRAVVGAPTKDNVNMKKLRLIASDHISDILFAKKVLFFEGDSELLFLTEFRRQILSDELTDIDIFKDDTDLYSQLKKSLLEISLIKMNGVRMASFCHEVCSNDKLNLDHLIIIDRDGIKDEKEPKKKKENIFYCRNRDIKDMTIKMTVQNEVSLNRNVETNKKETKDIKVFDGGKEEELQEDESPLPDGRRDKMKKENTFYYDDIEDVVIKMSLKNEELLDQNVEKNDKEPKEDKSALTDERRDKMKTENTFFWPHGDIEDVVIQMTLKNRALLDRNVEKNETETKEDESALNDKRKDMIITENTFFWLHGDIEDMVIKMSLTNKRKGLLDDLKEHKVLLDTNQYQKKKSQKLFLSMGVTIGNITKAVKCIFEHCTKENDLFQLITYLKCNDWNSFSD